MIPHLHTQFYQDSIKKNETPIAVVAPPVASLPEIAPSPTIDSIPQPEVASPEGKTHSVSFCLTPEVEAAAASPKTYTVPYLLIGAGTASHFAMKGILEKDPKAKVGFAFPSLPV
jgi:hypothetical protein